MINCYRLLSLLSICAPIGVSVLSTTPAAAQQTDENVIYIEPLFQYPTAPEEIISLGDKSDWLLEHFWDSFDFKQKNAVDQNALNDAFNVYSHPMRWASKDVVLKSTDKLVGLLKKNPTLMLQFTKAAEENLYGPRADAYIDEVYVKYLEGIVNTKKISDTRKERYARQLRILKNTLPGTVPPQFKFKNPQGATETFRPGLLTVIEFGDPECMDCRLAKLKMGTDLTFSSLVEKGKINVLFIIPDPDEGWEPLLYDYPKEWHTGASEEVSDIYDLRSTPYFYVIGTDGKIITKTGNVEEAMYKAVEKAN
ncbi:MAG: DUF5106 domain-containing protein [Muribaculaceae bacterium]|nr:DUF5106 domain-containing protein [Muribaculaceae bacterium]